MITGTKMTPRLDVASRILAGLLANPDRGRGRGLDETLLDVAMELAETMFERCEEADEATARGVVRKGS